MIEISHVSKQFSGYKAVDDVSVNIQENQVFGLIGTNGAGKSTLLRMMSGVYQPDAGSITIDGDEVYRNVKAKSRLFFIADEPYFFENGTPAEMVRYYQSVYPEFRTEKFYSQMKNFGLDADRKIKTFSKGMKKQLAVLLGIYSGTKYVFCDETFDGLDPVMRQGVKSIFASEMDERGMTPVIASHNLRELEDICDHVGLIHKGGVLLSKDIEELKCNIQKIQCVFANPDDCDKVISKLKVLKQETRGSLYTLTVRGTREEALAAFDGISMTFVETLGLSLEEIFISETEVVGYDIKKLILG